MRRLLLARRVALAALLAAPFASAQTFKVVMHSDVKALDPVWSGAYITRNLGYMLYDTLFALDENLQVKPQMVDKWETSAGRPDLDLHAARRARVPRRHAGHRRTTCIASLKRWAQRDSMGQKLAAYTAGVEGRSIPRPSRSC